MFRGLVVIRAFCFLFVLLCAFDTSWSETGRPPNVILFMADDLGYGELGCYGQRKIETPNIDRLAREGMRFTRAYSGSHVCAPSRSVLMTGLHTGHTPIRANGAGKYLYDSDITLAEVLKGKGYATGIFGKWGLGNESTPGRPLRQGFDRFVGQLEQVHAHFYYPYWIWQDETKRMLPENENGARGMYIHDLLHREALDFIRAHKDDSFFAYIPCIIPHVELVVPEDSEARYRGKFDRVRIDDPREGYIGSEDAFATFAGMVSRMDRGVGEIMKLLEDLGIDDDTIFLFTSDNGAQGRTWAPMTRYFNGNGLLRGYKNGFYEGGIRVPLIVRWPGHVESGSVSDRIVGFQDILPTFAELSESVAPSEIDGVSFAPTLLGDAEQEARNYLYWEYPRRNGIEQAVLREDWKFIRYPEGRVELYNLASDPAELHNVAEENDDIVARLSALLNESRTPEREYDPIPSPTIADYVR